MQRRDGCAACRLDGVGHGNHCRNPSVHGGIKGRPAARGERLLGPSKRSDVDLFSRHEPVGAHENLPVAHGGAHTIPGDRTEILRYGHRHALSPRSMHDCLGDGMFGQGFDCGDERQHFVPRHALDRHDVCESWLAFGDGSGLVERDHADLGEFL